MILTMKERMEIANLFPQQHNIITQVLVEDIAAKLKISQKEMEMISFKKSMSLNGVQFSWDESKAVDVEIKFTEAELRFLKNQVIQYDDQKKITQGMLSVCLKIQDTSIQNEKK